MGLSISSLIASYFGNFNTEVGLDGAGKTTILYRLKLGEVITTIPTIGFNVESVDYKNVTFNVWYEARFFFLPIHHHRTLGMLAVSQRSLWKFYLDGTDGLIFVVDSNDRERIDISRKELQELLSSEFMVNASVLIFANKQDLHTSLSLAEVTDLLQVYDIPQKNWHVQACCGINGNGLYEGLDWLCNILTTRR